MFILDLIVYHKPEGTLQKTKEFTVSTPLHSLSGSITKSTVSFFLAEFIDKVFKENEPDSFSFEFIEKAIQILDLLPDSSSNFHLVFLFQLSRYLGFFPENNLSESKQIFDMVSGKFITGIPTHPHFLNAEKSRLFFSIFNVSLNSSQSLKINSEERNELLDYIIEYYNLHLEKCGNIKSLEVLRNVFS